MTLLRSSQATASGTTVPAGARLIALDDAELPLESISISGTAGGGIARVRLLQRFRNPFTEPLDLTYQVPLPVDGVVSAYEVHAGACRIAGRVERREDATRNYEQARLDGRTAALLQQERPNVFTQRLGNIPPSTDVTVDLTIDHPLSWLSGVGWEWRFPTVVAPRYPGASTRVPDAAIAAVDVLDATGAPVVAAELTISDQRITPATSTTHSVDDTGSSVALTNDAMLDRDIAIRWTVSSSTNTSTLQRFRPATVQDSAEPAYGLLTIRPPAETRAHFSRDLVLLLDISGSMDGRPIAHLKAIVSQLIDVLDDEDHLEMVAFASRQVRYAPTSVRATAAERERALEWIRSLEAGGGTEMIPALVEALRPLRHDTPRQVVVVTDGLIGFESDAVRAIRDGLPPLSRLHVVGIGSASNRAFLRPAARAGRGTEVLIDLDEPAGAGAGRIVAATRQPVVVDLEVRGTALVDTPRGLPDLQAGAPVLAPLRLRPEGGTLIVRGRGVNGPWQETLAVPSTQPGNGFESVARQWARAVIEDLELELACGGDSAQIDPEIERIALEHSVSSRLTSWIAVALEPSVDPRDPIREVRVPQLLPYGMSADGLGLHVLSASASLGAIACFAMPASIPHVARRDEPDEDPQELDSLEAESERLSAEAATLHAEMARLHGLLDWAHHHKEDLRRHQEQVEAELQQTLERQHAILQLIERQRELLTGQVPPTVLRGRLIDCAAAGQPRTVVEIALASAVHWRPEQYVHVGSAVFPVGPGTTRPGPMPAGSIVRLELFAASNLLAAAGSLRLRSDDGDLLIELGGA